MCAAGARAERGGAGAELPASSSSPRRLETEPRVDVDVVGPAEGGRRWPCRGARAPSGRHVYVCMYVRMWCNMHAHEYGMRMST